MRIEKSFVIRAAPDAVWAFLTDPHQVAECLPGAAITGQVDDRTYEGTITVKIGPVSTSYRGQVRFTKLDPLERVAELTATGQDVRGRGGAEMTMSSRIIPRGAAASEVQVVQELNVTGMLAQLGRGMIEDVGDQLFQAFTDQVRARLEPAAAAGGPVAAGTAGTAPVQVMSLGAGALARAAGRAVRNPALWVALAALLLLLWWLLRKA